MEERYHMITVSELYNLDETIAAELLSGVEYPWEALPRIHDFIIELGNSLSEDVFEKRASTYGWRRAQK